MPPSLPPGASPSAPAPTELKRGGQIAAGVDADVLRLAFVSLAMTPMLLKDIFGEQMERPKDARFLEQLARFNGHLLAADLAPAEPAGEGEHR